MARVSNAGMKASLLPLASAVACLLAARQAHTAASEACEPKVFFEHRVVADTPARAHEGLDDGRIRGGAARQRRRRQLVGARAAGRSTRGFARRRQADLARGPRVLDGRALDARLHRARPRGRRARRTPRRRGARGDRRPTLRAGAPHVPAPLAQRSPPLRRRRAEHANHLEGRHRSRPARSGGGQRGASRARGRAGERAALTPDRRAPRARRLHRRVRAPAYVAASCAVDAGGIHSRDPGGARAGDAAVAFAIAAGRGGARPDDRPGESEERGGDVAAATPIRGVERAREGRS